MKNTITIESTIDFSALQKELLIDARAVGIPTGAAEIFVEHALKNLEANINPHRIITETDLNRAISKELKKYNADFAYVYENRDKII